MPITSLTNGGGSIAVSATIRTAQDVDDLADQLHAKLEEQASQYFDSYAAGQTWFGHFQVGDRVRIVKSDRASNVGREGFVTNRTYGSDSVLTVHKIDGGRTGFSLDDLRQNKLELVN
jgi:hypothetical protein